MDYFTYYSVMYKYGFAKKIDIWKATKEGFLTVEEYKRITGDDFDLNKQPI